MYVKRMIVLALLAAFFSQIAVAEDIVYESKEIIRNGTFEQNLYEAWHRHRCGISSLVAKDGEYGMDMADGLSSSTDRFFFQQLTIPSELESAIVSFDYRASEDYVVDHPPVQLQIVIAKSKGFNTGNMNDDETKAPPLTTIGTIHQETIGAAFDWKAFTAALDAPLIAEMQAARDAGEFLFILFYQTKIDQRHGFKIAVDNVSFTVSGIQRVPEMHGSIAYLEDDDDGDPYSVGILDPNDGSLETIWTHPDGKFGTYSNVTWNPDATELAFVSDHNFQFSVFTSEIYAIKPDGSGLHRIPHILTPEEIEAGNYPRVTVNGTVRVDSGEPGASYSILLGINGTDKGVWVTAAEGESVGFTIYDVPVLDNPNVLSQMMIIRYSGGGCSAGIEYAAATGMVVNGSVDIGTISFFAMNCMGNLVGYQANNLSYKYDGSEIGFSLLGLRKVRVDATKETDIDELEPQAGTLSFDLARSPVDNRFLYTDFSFTHGGEDLYISDENSEPRLLIHHDIESVIPVWLPDGSGFIYVGWPEDENGFDDVIYQFDLASMQKQRLTYFRREVIDHLGISPDGHYIVFQLHKDRRANNSDLWIMDRLNPPNMWPIAGTSRVRGCEWSSADVGAVHNNDDTNDGGQSDPADSSDPGGGGGGGCFIAVWTR